MANEVRRLSKSAHGRNDPIQKALREQSTHKQAQTRITVYERLGLNKPGFWADWADKKLNYQDSQEEPAKPSLATFAAAPEQEKEPPVEIEDNAPKLWHHKAMQVSEGQQTQASSGKDKLFNKQAKTQWAQLVANQGLRIQKAKPMMGTTALDVIDANTIKMAKELSTAFMKESDSVRLSTVSVDYFVKQSEMAADIRHKNSFNSNASSNFMDIYNALNANKKKIKGNTNNISVQANAQFIAKVKGKSSQQQTASNGVSIGAKGYSSNYYSGWQK